jgi:hypothetical protein
MWPLVSYGVHSSNCMTMSLFRSVWICIETSGVRNSLSPLTGEANFTPSSLILRISPRLQTWKPPLSVRIGLCQLLEAVQAAELLEHVQAGPHPQVEGVAQDDLRAHLLQRARHHALDGAVGAHGHEDRRLHDAVVQGQAAAAREAFGGEEFELQHVRRPCVPAASRRRS